MDKNVPAIKASVIKTVIINDNENDHALNLGSTQKVDED